MLFKRQSGEMSAVKDELTEFIKEANDLLQTVRTTMRPPASGLDEDDIPTVPPPPLPMTPIEEDPPFVGEARSVYAIVRRPAIRPIKKP